MRILLIEDDKALCRVLQPTLQAAGFASDCCHTGADACILDRMLPELDGLTLLKSARADGISIPVLMLTALGQIGDRVEGLDAGADDYLAKPFDNRELLARLRALVRRPADLHETAHRIACGDLVLDTAQLTLTGPSSTVTLSRRECDLAAFCRAPGLLRARAVLLGSVWGSAAEIEDCSLDSYIRFIRRRLTAVGSRAVLRTVRGAGYRFLPDGEENAHA
mgnify:CR=1 FL=1